MSVGCKSTSLSGYRDRSRRGHRAQLYFRSALSASSSREAAMSINSRHTSGIIVSSDRSRQRRANDRNRAASPASSRLLISMHPPEETDLMRQRRRASIAPTALTIPQIA
jgi:hypothetical protein